MGVPQQKHNQLDRMQFIPNEVTSTLTILYRKLYVNVKDIFIFSPQVQILNYNKYLDT